MANSLKILIQASLNRALSITEINKAILEISNSPSLQKIKVKIDIDSKILDTLATFNKNINQITQATQAQTGAINNTTGAIIKETQAVKDATDAQKKLNLERQRTIIDPVTNKAISTTSTYGNNQNNNKRIENVLSDGSLKGNIIETANQAKDLKQTEQLIKAKEELRKKIVELAQVGQLTTVKLQELARGTNQSKSVSDIQKVIDKYRELKSVSDSMIKNQSTQYQTQSNMQKQAIKDAASLLAIQNKAELQVMNLTRRYGSNVDSAGLNSYLGQLKALDPAQSTAKAKALELSNEINRIGASARSTAGHTLSFGEALAGSLTKMSAFMVGGALITAPFQFIKEGITYVNELNKSLTELSIVYMKSQSEVARYGEQFHTMGMQMGISTQELANGAVEFARQGLSAEETTKRMATAVQYAKISNIEFSTSAKILTAVVNSMGVDITRATDVWAYMGDATATSASEIGEAMQRVGGTAGAIGLEFEKVSSWIAVVSSRTRESAFTIGNSIKSIIARVQSMKENGFAEEDGTQVNQVAKALAEVDIKLMDSQGNFRNFGTVMDEIGAKWDTLNSRQRAYISTTLAGSYQSARFMNIMEGYSESVDLYAKSLDSAGIAQQKFDLYQEGTEANLTKMKNAFTGVFQSSFDSSAIRGLFGVLTTLGTTIDSLIKSVGFLPVAVGTLSVALLFLGNTTKTLVLGAGTSLLSFMGIARTSTMALTVATNTWATSMGLTATAARGLSIAAASLTRVFLPLAAISAVAFGISALTDSISESNDAQKSMEDRNKKIVTSWTTQKDSIEKLILEYNKLDIATNSGKLTTDAEQNQKYLDVTNKLAELMPNLVKNIDEKGQAHLKNADAIKQELEFSEKLTSAEQKRQLSSASDDFRKNLYKKKSIQDDLNETNKTINKGTESIGALGERRVVKLSESSLDALRVKALGLQSQLAEENNKIKDSILSITSAATELSGIKLSEGLGKDLQSIVDSMSLNGLNEDQLSAKALALSALFAKLNDIKNLRSSSNSPDASESSNREEESFRKLAGTIGLNVSQANKLIDTMFEVKTKTDGVKGATLELSNKVNALNKGMEDSEKTVSTLASAYQKLQQGEELSATEILKLADAHPKLLEYLTTHNGLITDKGAILQEVANIERQTRLEEAQGLLASVTDTFNALESKRKMYADYYSKLSTATTSPILGENSPLAKFGQTFIGGMTKAEETAIANAEKQKNELQLRVDLLSRPLDLATSGISTKKDKPDTTPSPYDESQKFQIDEYKNAIERLDAKLKESESIMTRFKDTSVEYRIELEKQTDIINEKQKLTVDEGIRLRGDIADLESKIANTGDQKGKNALLQQFDQASKSLADLSTKWWDYQVTIEQSSKKAKESLYNYSKDWIANEKADMETNLKSSLEIAQMEADGWLRIQENKDKYAPDNQDEIAKNIAASQRKLKEETFNLSKNWIDEETASMQLLGKSEVEVARTTYEAWNRVNAKRDQFTQKDQDDISKNLLKSKNDLKKAELTNSENWITEETTLYKIAGKSEIEIAQMVLEARNRMANENWTKERDIIELTKTERLNAEKDVADASWNLINTRIKAATHEVSKYDDALSASKSKMSLLTEGSAEYTNELSKQVNILKDKLKAEESVEQSIRDSMNTVNLSKENWEDLNDQLRKSIINQINIAQQLSEQVKVVADDIVSIYKDMYEKQKDVALKGIENEMKALEKSHKQKVDMLDEEMNKYDEFANAKMKALDDQANKDDYDSQLTKLQKERDGIANKISISSLNDSPEAKARRADLQKQLDEKNDEINKFTTDRSRTLEKEALQQELDDKKKKNDAEKTLEDKAYEKSKELLDKRTEDTNKMYDDMLNDEREFAKIREEIARGNFDRIKNDFANFQAFLTTNSGLIGNSITENLSDKMTKASSSIDLLSISIRNQFGETATSLQNGIIKTIDDLIVKLTQANGMKFTPPPSSGNNPTANPSSASNTNVGTGEYVGSGSETSTIDQMKKNSRLWDFADEDRKKQLHDANETMGYTLGATYANGTWYKNDLPLYHNGGEVGVSGTSQQSWKDKILNSNELLSIVKKGEVVLNEPMQFINDIASRLMGGVKNFDFSKLAMPQSNSQSPMNHIEINIGSVIGDKKSADDFSRNVINRLTAKGVSI